MSSDTLTIPDQKKVGMVSLGCPKALVDSERILTRLRAEGYAISPDYQGADAVIVNTCGFLDSAKAESLDAIGEALVENGRVIVTGCLGAEPDYITGAHPKVLAVTGPHQYEQVLDAVHAAVPPRPDPFVDLLPAQAGDQRLRHAVELRHPSFACEEVVAACRARGVAIVLAADSDYPMIADQTADFSYLRIMGTTERYKAGYAPRALDLWARRAGQHGRGDRRAGAGGLVPGRSVTC